jgi:hypothetical protein
MRTGGSRSAPNAPRPDIVVDFNSSEGLLFVSLKNIGARSAYRVCTVFDKPLLGLGGQKCISDLQLFRCTEFVPPGKEFSQFIDPLGVWFKQNRPNQYTITLTYSDREGKRFRERIIHDLDVYRDLGYISTSGGKDARHT